MRSSRKPSPISDRRRARRNEFVEFNRVVWIRDEGRCVLCDSRLIQGTPFKSGAHHIINRGQHQPELNDAKNGCLLCVLCHTNADTTEMKRRLLKLLEVKYGYDYYNGEQSNHFREYLAKSF